MREVGPAAQKSQKQALHERIDRDFGTHKLSADADALVEEFRQRFSDLAHDVVEACEPSRELSRALTFLEDAQTEVVKAIARNG